MAATDWSKEKGIADEAYFNALVVEGHGELPEAIDSTARRKERRLCLP